MGIITNGVRQIPRAWQRFKGGIAVTTLALAFQRRGRTGMLVACLPTDGESISIAPGSHRGELGQSPTQANAIHGAIRFKKRSVVTRKAREITWSRRP